MTRNGQVFFLLYTLMKMKIIKYKYYNILVNFYSKKVDEHLKNGNIVKVKKWLTKKLLLAPKMREILEKRK